MISFFGLQGNVELAPCFKAHKRPEYIGVHQGMINGKAYQEFKGKESMEK
jgi:hypothetical protein